MHNITKLEQTITSLLTEMVQLRSTVLKTEREKQTSIEQMLLMVIDVLDSFDKIEKEKSVSSENEASGDQKNKDRYKIIRRKLEVILEAYDVEVITFPENIATIPFIEVIGTEPKVGGRKDEIISIIKQGYQRNEIVIRPAHVIVVKN